MTAVDVAKLLQGNRYSYSNERELQDALETVLQDGRVGYQREHRFNPKDRPDFYLPKLKTVVEVKIKSSAAVVSRQIERYGQLPGIETIILVTTRMTHSSVPASVNGRDVLKVTLWNL